MLAVTAGAICFVPETLPNPKRLNEISLRPRLGVPQSIWLQFISPASAASQSLR
jgi:hypothetical protein